MKKLLSLLLALSLILSCAFVLSSCGEKIDTALDIRVSVLNGTTGFGAAKLMNDAKNENAALNYSFKVETDASVINAALINNEIDIAALPTNASSTIYNKTKGGVKITGTAAFHDPEQGALRGKNVIFAIEADGLKIVHLGDLGHMPDEEQLAAMKNADLILMPIGGTFTITNLGMYGIESFDGAAMLLDKRGIFE